MQWLRFAPIACILFLQACASPTERSTASDPAVSGTSLTGLPTDCSLSELSSPPQTAWSVRGQVLGAAESKHIHWVAHCVMRFLPGDRSQQIDLAAKTLWWALREGNLERPGSALFRYSNCHVPQKGDRDYSDLPLTLCSGKIWQVGAAGVQVSNFDIDTVNEQIDQLFNRLNLTRDDQALLRWTADLAGHAPESKVSKAILQSKGKLRKSWLLRNPLVSYPLVIRNIEAECTKAKQPQKWCLQGSYPAAKNFSKTIKNMRGAIEDLRNILSSQY